MIEPCTSTCAGIAALTMTAANAAVSSFGAKVGDYAADRTIEAYDAGWQRDKASGGISSWSDEPDESPVTD